MTATRAEGALRIVRLANFVTPVSGGLRTALHHLGAGYREAGHEPVLIVPGPRQLDEDTEQGRVITLPGPVVPGTGGYRVLADRRAVTAVLEMLDPDRIEVSDRTTLRWTGEWARRRRVPSVMVSHESVDGVLRMCGIPQRPARRAADLLNTRTARAYSRIVCTTAWAAAEFERIGARNVVHAPLGVDLESCAPPPEEDAARTRLWYARPDQILLAVCTRLSVEKQPGRALDTLAELRARGHDAVLVVAGAGPLRVRLERRARQDGLPVRFLGHVADKDALHALMACADVVLAPGPVETFGLSALEALACGTPVVVSASSALPAVIGPAGAAAADDAGCFADAVGSLLARPESARRAVARAHAERYGWRNAVTAFLAALDAAPVAADLP
ncbi:glycosyltransferase [Streptomyces sp. RB6PN25]|uniref:Glycosyltransferase n=1 Tax=Streptomyces humicola TaxID=2953240 RepID=A0ABT1Q0W8_9ACTN|nr:glycosyltransferase [Streptomyces humicola]MCQ4083568.1 glycosyltransferase [Streptomyces humicola]